MGGISPGQLDLIINFDGDRACECALCGICCRNEGSMCETIVVSLHPFWIACAVLCSEVNYTRTSHPLAFFELHEPETNVCRFTLLYLHFFCQALKFVTLSNGDKGERVKYPFETCLRIEYDLEFAFNHALGDICAGGGETDCCDALGVGLCPFWCASAVSSNEGDGLIGTRLPITFLVL